MKFTLNDYQIYVILQLPEVKHLMKRKLALHWSTPGWRGQMHLCLFLSNIGIKQSGYGLVIKNGKQWVVQFQTVNLPGMTYMIVDNEPQTVALTFDLIIETCEFWSRCSKFDT